MKKEIIEADVCVDPIARANRKLEEDYVMKHSAELGTARHTLTTVQGNHFSIRLRLLIPSVAELVTDERINGQKRYTDWDTEQGSPLEGDVLNFGGTKVALTHESAELLRAESERLRELSPVCAAFQAGL